MVEITLEVPESLAERLNSMRPRIVEVLERGLGDLSPLPSQVYRYILDFMASNPSPEDMVNFGPTPEMQARASELLDKNRNNALTPAEETELDEYARIDHLVTIFKARALHYLTPTTTKRRLLKVT